MALPLLPVMFGAILLFGKKKRKKDTIPAPSPAPQETGVEETEVEETEVEETEEPSEENTVVRIK